MTRLVLVRHGEAQAHVDGVVGGERGCSGLSDLGRRQAASLRDRLKATGELGEVGALWASTLPRAAETAQILAPAVGDLEVCLDRDLREFDPGEGDGLVWEDFKVRYPMPEVWDPQRPRVPGGDSPASFRARVEAALLRLAEAHQGETVVIACHGGVIEQAFHLWGAAPTSLGVAVEVQNTGLTEFLWCEPLSWHPPGPSAWRLVRHNDAAHLLGIV
jgi:probable phosphoglycerate mutase